MSNESDLSYVSKSILNVMPDAIDLSKEIKYSSYVTKREYVEVFPSNAGSTINVTSSNLGSSCKIILADPSRWLDKRSGCLVMDIGGLTITTPATQKCNFAVLDGPCAMINKVNVYVNGQMLHSGSISNFNKIATALQVNNGSIASYLSDESALTGGCEKLKYVLTNSTLGCPETQSFYQSVANSPYNLVPLDVSDAALFDCQGFLTGDGNHNPKSAAALAAGYGQSMTGYTSTSKQTISIPLSTLSSFFDAYEMLPLFITREVIIELFWASPTQTFASDYRTATALVSAPLAFSGYTIDNLRVCCDLVTCSEEINDLYRLKAASSEGIIIPYDDIAVSAITQRFGSNKTQQAVLSTSNLKSLLYFRQADLVHQSQNGWSNSNYAYLGCTNFSVKINNSLTPQAPLVSPQAILTYNMKNRASLNNQLSNCIANNPFVFYRAECIPTAAGAVAADIPAALTSFMIYNNFERIFEEIDVGNGVSLANAGSQITVQYTDDPAAAAKATVLLGGPATYTSYMVMTYGKAIIFADGTTQIRG